MTSPPFDPAIHIQIAADDITKLRSTDVFRLLDQCPNEHLQTLITYINTHRPDLTDEVNASLNEL